MPSTSMGDASVHGGVEARHANQFGWHAGDDRVGGHVLGHDCACTDYRAIADGHAWDDRHSGTEPDLASDHDRCVDHVAPSVGVDPVVGRCQVAAGAGEAAVADGDVFGKQETASDIDEDVLTEGQVLAELA